MCKSFFFTKFNCVFFYRSHLVKVYRKETFFICVPLLLRYINSHLAQFSSLFWVQQSPHHFFPLNLLNNKPSKRHQQQDSFFMGSMCVICCLLQSWPKFSFFRGVYTQVVAPTTRFEPMTFSIKLQFIQRH